MITLMTRLFTKLAHKYIPDAYIFALLLTIFVFICGVFLGNTPLNMIQFWGDGFWNLLTFSMQMALILITGFTLAKTEPVKKSLMVLTRFAKGSISAISLVTIVSAVACFINWGFGLIVSAMFAIAISQKVKKVNFGLMIASAYSGFLLWHGGLSGSIPLKLTNPSLEIQNIIGTKSISLSHTIYSSMNLTLLLSTLITILIVNILMNKEQSIIVECNSPKVDKINSKNSNNFADKLEESKLLNFIIVLGGLIYVYFYFKSENGISLNIIIFIFLLLAMGLSVNSKIFLENFNDSVKDSSGILLQFPFYAGLMGMMSSSGIAESLSNYFVSISTQKTFLVYTYLSAGIVNFFVPSGGGQWVLQGPIILSAAKTQGVDLAKASMAIAWGDAWSNMIQPFWALPILSVGKISLKDMMGYCVVIFIASGLVSSLVFLFYS